MVFLESVKVAALNGNHMRADVVVVVVVVVVVGVVVVVVVLVVVLMVVGREKTEHFVGCLQLCLFLDYT